MPLPYTHLEGSLPGQLNIHTGCKHCHTLHISIIFTSKYLERYLKSFSTHLEGSLPGQLSGLAASVSHLNVSSQPLELLNLSFITHV
jgi:hypothetical protein